MIGFFTRLANHDKQFVVVAGAAHSLVLGYNRARFFHALDAFLTPPARVDRLSV